jgi:hypothetical protein
MVIAAVMKRRNNAKMPLHKLQCELVGSCHFNRRDVSKRSVNMVMVVWYDSYAKESCALLAKHTITPRFSSNFKIASVL